MDGIFSKQAEAELQEIDPKIKTAREAFITALKEKDLPTAREKWNEYASLVVGNITSALKENKNINDPSYMASLQIHTDIKKLDTAADLEITIEVSEVAKIVEKKWISNPASLTDQERILLEKKWLSEYILQENLDPTNVIPFGGFLNNTLSNHTPNSFLLFDFNKNPWTNGEQPLQAVKLYFLKQKSLEEFTIEDFNNLVDLENMLLTYNASEDKEKITAKMKKVSFSGGRRIDDFIQYEEEKEGQEFYNRYRQEMMKKIQTARLSNRNDLQNLLSEGKILAPVSTLLYPSSIQWCIQTKIYREVNNKTKEMDESVSGNILGKLWGEVLEELWSLSKKSNGPSMR